MNRPEAAFVIVAVFTLAGVGCTETRTPTEVPAFVAPTPAPTPVPQPASMSGFVRGYFGSPNEGARVECQGKSTTAGIGGAYALPGLLSGTTPVTVRWQEQGTDTTQDFTVPLQPGPNQVDFRTGP